MMKVDILIAGDFRFPGGTSTSISSEARALVKAGYKVGLLALATGPLRPSRPIHPEIWALHQSGSVPLVPPGTPVEAQLCCLHHPAAFARLPAIPPLVTSRKRIIVAHHPSVDALGQAQYDVPTISALVEDIFGPAVWAPVGPNVRKSLQLLRSPPPLTPEDWHNVLDPDDFADLRLRLPRGRPVIGRHSRPQPEKWPEDRQTFVAAYPDDPDVIVRLMGCPEALEAEIGPHPTNWELLPFGALPVPAFLGSLDYFSYFHGPAWVEAFGRSVLEAMASGLVCLLPQSFEPLFGDGAVYCEPAEVLAHVRRFESDPVARRAQVDRAIEKVRQQFGLDRAVARADALIGPPAARRAPTTASPSARGGGVLYLTSNGIGMGHLTRCMATARRLPPETARTVVTMSKAFDVVREEGMTVEHLPYYRSVGLDHERWSPKLCAELTEILRYHAPQVFVFDGNVPYDGMCAALEQFPGIWKVWQRRALWRPGVGMKQLERSSFFDVVVEPGEIAAPVDRGLTSTQTENVLRVPPVRFLDTLEALPRHAARQILGFESDRPALLLQLGAENNFDLGRPARTVFDMTDPATGSRELDVILARWRISERNMQVPPHVRILDTFPIARYLNAFDCAIATAGYNTFHENIAACLPTLFVPNDHPDQDEQWLRAEYAVFRGLALWARADDPYRFRREFERLLQPETRLRLAAACAVAKRDNGAAVTAEFLDGLAHTRKASELVFRNVGGAW